MTYARFRVGAIDGWPGIGAILAAAERADRTGEAVIWGVTPDGQSERVGVLRVTSKGVELEGIEPAEGGENAEGCSEQAAAI